ncbi:CU044_5270 family protein [Frankia sp. AgKG'84/4]|uniref:CU044_5270 family protein n=1 Tax=Frankia sp. AgKG'84/4 TaxID=573490 RepID=UPI00200BF91C|nr:CU044_5270 family protein [Frankia sp. AgKG'84/4]MCL9794176.1 CU044_5270 family protein [Frankia sp. AgKG'84/4]
MKAGHRHPADDDQDATTQLAGIATLARQLATAPPSVPDIASRARAWRRRQARKLAPAVVAAAAAAAVAVSAGVIPGSGGDSPAAVTAAPAPAPPMQTVRFLSSMASVAAAQSAPRPDVFWYERVADETGPATESWESTTQTGLLRAADPQQTSAIAPTAAVTYFAYEPLTFAQMRALPLDPAVLAARMRATLRASGRATGEHRTGSDQEMFESVRYMLGWGQATPELRAALYRMLATLPGVRVLGQGTDPHGRRGSVIVVALPLGGVRAMLVDPADGRLLAAGASPDDASPDDASPDDAASQAPAPAATPGGPGPWTPPADWTYRGPIHYNVIFEASGYVNAVGRRPE